MKHSNKSIEEIKKEFDDISMAHFKLGIKIEKFNQDAFSPHRTSLNQTDKNNIAFLLFDDISEEFSNLAIMMSRFRKKGCVQLHQRYATHLRLLPKLEKTLNLRGNDGINTIK